MRPKYGNYGIVPTLTIWTRNGFGLVYILFMFCIILFIPGCLGDTPKTVLVLMFDETTSFCEHPGIWESSKEAAIAAIDRLFPGDTVLVMGIDDKGFDEDDVRVPFYFIPKASLMSLKSKKELAQIIRNLEIRSSSSGCPKPDDEQDPETQGIDTKGIPYGTDVIGALHMVCRLVQSAEEETSYFRIIIFSDFNNEPPEEWENIGGANYSRTKPFEGDWKVIGLNVVEPYIKTKIVEVTGEDEGDSSEEEIVITTEKSLDDRIGYWVQVFQTMGLQCSFDDFKLMGASTPTNVQTYMDGWLHP